MKCKPVNVNLEENTKNISRSASKFIQEKD